MQRCPTLDESWQLAQRCATPSRGLVHLKVQGLDEHNFRAAIDEFEGLIFVKFFALWCRTCCAISPIYAKVATKYENATDVNFREVNFKEAKELCLSERVFQLPAIHFYGRVNRFTLGSAREHRSG